jgi:hypothetical protein
MLPIISTKKRRNYKGPLANLAGNAISPATRLRQIQSFILPDRKAFIVSKLTLENYCFCAMRPKRGGTMEHNFKFTFRVVRLSPFVE